MDIIRHDYDGLLVPLKEPQAMAEAVLALHADPAWAGQLGARAQVKVRQNFMLEQHAERVERVYQQVLGRAVDSTSLGLAGRPI
jgi:glycosyltransferase involved in cell wall biosynthesis